MSDTVAPNGIAMNAPPYHPNQNHVRVQDLPLEHECIAIVEVRCGVDRSQLGFAELTAAGQTSREKARAPMKTLT